MPTRPARRNNGFFARPARGLLLALLLVCVVLAGAELARPGLVSAKIINQVYRVVAMTWELPPGVFDILAGSLPAPDFDHDMVRAGDALPAADGLGRMELAMIPLSASAAQWKNHRGESEQGPGWTEPAFDDSAWEFVQTPLASAPGGAPALLASNSSSDSLPVTTYFRREFTVADPSIYRLLDLELLRDDGAVVYLNGVEVFRSNLPDGEVTSQTPALAVVLGGDETRYFHHTVDAAALKPGRNVLAVELHQAEGANPDVRFDLILRGALAPVSVRFAVIGDYGSGGANARAVAEMIKAWDVDFIITTGDNNYPDGEAKTMDKNVGKFYHDYIFRYRGKYGPGAEQNRFFPTMGNHEWGDVPDAEKEPNAYFNYFTLPPGQGGERYYDFHWGPVQFFALNSDVNEPDGITSNSKQAAWLQKELADSEAPWKLVYMHHPPYSSTSLHPPGSEINWPFAEWGASLVMSGHDHYYEHIAYQNMHYFINGAGGGDLYAFGPPVEGSQTRFTGDYGAMLVQASPCSLISQFITIRGAVVDTVQLDGNLPACR